MMASRASVHVQPEYGYDRQYTSRVSDSSRSTAYTDMGRSGYEDPYYAASRASNSSDMTTSGYSPIMAPNSSGGSLVHTVHSGPLYNSSGYNIGSSSAIYETAGPSYDTYTGHASSWEAPARFPSEPSMDAYVTSPSPTDYGYESSSRPAAKPKSAGNSHSQPRRPSNRDEFDGPHQFLQPPPPEYIAQQERDLPHLPTNLVVHEQDSVLTQVNDRLSQCAFDFVAKYQFPIPTSGSMRPVERPQDREWSEWVYLLKRLATKRRIPARVLYNGQIKQFVTVLENSLEMRHAAKHQSRPLKDDRNILQLISAGIQVAKLLKDSLAMSFLDQLYVDTEKQIQDRSFSRAYRC